MKSITIHGLDEILAREIYEKAERQGVSLNKTIKELYERLPHESHQELSPS